MRLKSGDYRQGLPLHELSGHAGQPIIIEALNPSAPLPRFIARPGANAVSLINVRYLVLRYLELDGRNLPVDAILPIRLAHQYATYGGLALFG